MDTCTLPKLGSNMHLYVAVYTCSNIKATALIPSVTYLHLSMHHDNHCHITITTAQVSRNERSWKQWFDKEAPEEAQIPDGYHISLDSFRKLLLIR